MSTLSGSQARVLSDILRDAFNSDALDEFLYFAMNKRREDITLAQDYRARVYRLIRIADSEGWILSLVAVVREARPRNAALQAIAAELGIATAPTSFERIIQANAPFVDMSIWRAQLGELEAQVCRVEVSDGLQTTFGTGFLVGPDICMTNYHVVEPLIKGNADPAQARLRFDYKRTADTVVNEGIQIPLAREWLVEARPPSAIDYLAAPGDQVPATDELDFALLRLREAPGEQAVGHANALSDAPKRGWIHRIGTNGYGSESLLLLLQHPAGAPLKLAFGQSAGLNASATRLRHRINTEGGSSGSPCLNVNLELVAIHHWGDPNFDVDHKPIHNSAVPIAAISDYLATAGLQSQIFLST